MVKVKVAPWTNYCVEFALSSTWLSRHIRPPSDDGSASKITEADRQTIKSLIIDVMVRLPEREQKQISEAIAEIGKIDFPQNKWHVQSSNGFLSVMYPSSWICVKERRVGKSRVLDVY
jgi:hypothetical protein